MDKVKEKHFNRYRNFALVTGAASGMGREYVLSLAARGYSIIAVDINGAGLEETASLVRQGLYALDDYRKEYVSSFVYFSIVQDLSQKEAAQNIYDAVMARGYEVEFLVNNAGLMFFREICETPVKMLDLVTMVHMYTPLMLCRLFVPHMRERKHGYVLNISSLAEQMNWPGIGMYGSTKRFVKDYSRELRIECQKTGVSVTTAYFGAVATPLVPISDNLKKLARFLRVMVTPQTAVKRALNATFHRRRGVMPGLLNWIFWPIIVILPNGLLGFLYRKCTFLRTNFDKKK